MFRYAIKIVDRPLRGTLGVMVQISDAVAWNGLVILVF